MIDYPDLKGINDRLFKTLQAEAEHKSRLAGRYSAEEIFDHLQERLREFQNALEDDEELGVRLANFGEAARLHIRSIGYANPNLIEFYCVNSEGEDVTLVQHLSQLSFMLVAVKALEAEEPYRVGFQ